MDVNLILLGMMMIIAAILVVLIIKENINFRREFKKRI